MKRKFVFLLITVLPILPFEQPTTYTIVINFKAAKQMGLTLSPELLSRANKVIQ